LTVPFDHPHDPAYRLNVRELANYCKSNQDSTNSEHRLIETWTKLVRYSNIEKLSHETFLHALSALLHDEQWKFFTSYPSKTLPEMAVLLANRFITNSTFTDALAQLQTFTRQPSETLRKTMARL
jgi:hypothetical protein